MSIVKIRYTYFLGDTKLKDDMYSTGLTDAQWIKCHMVVDKNRFLLVVVVTVAHIHNSRAGMSLMRVLQDCFHNIKMIIADEGVRSSIVNEVKEKFEYYKL